MCGSLAVCFTAQGQKILWKKVLKKFQVGVEKHLKNNPLKHWLMGAVEVIGWILTGLFLAGLLSSVIIGFVGLPEKELDNVLAANNITIEQKGLSFVAMEIAMKDITPSFRKEWIGGGSYGSQYHLILEDLPTPDELDIIGFLIIIPTLWLLFKWETDSSGQLVAKILLIVLMFPLAFIASKLFYFWLYYEAGSDLGLSQATLTAVRESQLSVFDSILGPMFLLSLTSLALMVKKAIGSATD